MPLCSKSSIKYKNPVLEWWFKIKRIIKIISIMYSEKYKKLSYQSELEKTILNIAKSSTEPLTLDKISTKLSHLATFHSKKIKAVLKNDLK